MDHNEVIRLKTAERYLLGELKGEERYQYEDHYFGCPECARDLTAGAVFMDNARDILTSEKTPVPAAVARPSAPGWFSLFLRPAFAAPAFALLLLVAAYQSAIVIPQLKTALGQASEPQTIPSFSLVKLNSRGVSNGIEGASGGQGFLAIRVPANKPFSLYLDIPPETQFPYYTCELQSESGGHEFSVTLSSAEAKNSIQLLVPASRLGAGMHQLVVRGSESPAVASAANPEVARYSFALEIAK